MTQSAPTPPSASPHCRSPKRSAAPSATRVTGSRPVCSTAPSPSAPASTSCAVLRRWSPSAIEAARDDLAQVGGDLSWYGVAWAWALRLALGRLFGEKLWTRRPDRLTPGAQPTGGGWCGPIPTNWCWPRSGGSAETAGSPADRRAPPRMEQAAAFRPKGLLGLAYWWALWPVHQVVFRVMVRSRVRRAARRHPHWRRQLPADASSVGSTTAP